MKNLKTTTEIWIHNDFNITINPRNTIFFWIREVIHKGYVFLGEDLAARIRALETCSIAPSVI